MTKRKQTINTKEEEKKVSWNSLENLEPKTGEFIREECVFAWCIPEKKRETVVVGIDIGIVHLGIVGLNKEKKVTFFAMCNVRNGEKSTSMQEGLDVAFLFFDSPFLNEMRPLVKTWLLEQQLGTMFIGGRTVQGNIGARMASIAIKTMLQIDARKEERQVITEDRAGKSKYSIVPLIVQDVLKDPLRQEKLTGSKNLQKRKVLGRNDAFALMKYLEDPCLQVLELIENNLGRINSKKSTEMDKIYDITDAYLIAQNYWKEELKKSKKKKTKK